MTAASALVTGFEPTPQLAEHAVRQALECAGLDQARGVILFLSADFARHSQAAVLAAARAAGCLQVAGMVANGVFNETGWVLDQPAAVALILGHGLALGPGDSEDMLLSFNASPTLPAEWQSGPSRFGLTQADSALWQQGRPAGHGRAETAISGARCRLAVSTGLRCLGEAQLVDQAHGHDLGRVGGWTALDSLLRALPPELRTRSPLPTHLIGVVRDQGEPLAIPLLTANADGSLTLAERLHPGEAIRWSLRQPIPAEADMHGSLERAADECHAPVFGLMLSCIGRGPLFYGHDDRDLALLRQRFPGMPLAGAYGSGQIAPLAGRNRQLQNSVVTALFEIDHHV